MQPRSSRIASLLLTILALLFAVVGAGFGVWAVSGIFGYLQTQGWEETPAKIVRAELKSHSSSNRSSEKVLTEYTYRYQGQSYTGHRVSLDDGGSFEQSALPGLLAAKKSGGSFRCYVNPAQPEEATLFRDFPWRMLLFRSAFVLVFGGMGFGLLASQFGGHRLRRHEAALARAHPDEPWLWKKEWAGGRIRGSAASLVAPLLFAGVWNSFFAAWWLAVLLNGTGRPIEQLTWWFLIAFTSIGIGMIGWAVVSVARWRKFGRSIFEMASVPGVIGGQLAGVIRTPVKIEPQDVFQMRLHCVHCTLSRDSSRSIMRSIVWQNERVITHDLLEQDVNHSAIPVLFQIPYECRQTDDNDPYNMIAWTLEVSANTPGLNYRAEFSVPVFKTPRSDPHFVADRALAEK